MVCPRFLLASFNINPKPWWFYHIFLREYPIRGLLHAPKTGAEKEVSMVDIQKRNSTWMREAPKFMRFCWCFVLEIPAIYIYMYTNLHIYIYKPTVHGRGVNRMGFQLPLPASTWLLSLDPKTKLRVSTKQPTSFKEGHHLGGWGLVAIC